MKSLEQRISDIISDGVTHLGDPRMIARRIMVEIENDREQQRFDIEVSRP